MVMQLDKVKKYCYKKKEFCVHAVVIVISDVEC